MTLSVMIYKAAAGFWDAGACSSVGHKEKTDDFLSRNVLS